MVNWLIENNNSIAMPYLSFDVDADYTELIRLQQEIAKTKSQLQNFRPGQAGASIDVLNKKLAESTARYRQLAQAAIRSGADMEFGLKKNLSGIFTEVNRIQDLLTRPMMAVGGLAGVYGLGEFLTKITSIRGQFQQMNASIETMIGKRKGEKLNAELQEFAKISPLEFAPTVSTAQMMLGFGIDADKVPRYLQAIGDIAMGDTRRFQSLSLAFSQMSAAGKLMGQDLMQMVNAGFQPLQIISEKTGKSIGTLKEEMSQGKISAEMVQQAFLDATSEGGKYYKMSETASKTIPGAIAKLNDSMDLMLNDMGQNMEGALVGAIDAASTIVDNIGRIIPVLATAAAAFGVYKTSVMLSNFAAKQSVIDASKGIVDGFNAELAKIQEMQNAKMMEGYDDDIRKALEKGSIDQTYADAIQQGRLWQQEQQRIAENERRIAEEAQQTYETHLKDMQTQREQAGRGLDTDLNDSNANGIITNDTAERLQNERDYAQALVDTKQAALDSANMQKAASDQLVEAAERRVESAKELMEMAEAAGDADDKKAAAEEYMAAVEEQASAITAQQSAVEGVNTAEKELNGAITAQQAVQKQTATAAVIGETTATTANTAATNVNTAATSRGTIVTALATAKDKALTIGKYALTAATNACKNAWNGLKVAFMTNPIGMIITALTTVIGLFMSFKKESGEASAEVERFGEAAVKTRNNAQTLFAVLASTTEQSKVHKDALSELERIAKEYGVVLDEEKDKYSQLIKNRERLIELIMEEGRQRQIANNIASYQQEQDNLMNDFREKMVEHIKDENDDEKTKASATILTNLFMEKVSEKRKEVIDIIHQLDEKEKQLALENANGEYADTVLTAKLRGEIGKMRTDLLKDMNEEGRKVAQEMGIKYQIDLNDMYGCLREYVVQLDAGAEAMDAFVKNQEENRNRLEELKPDTLTDYSKAQVEDLAKALSGVQSQIGDINKTAATPKVNSLEIKAAKDDADSATESINAIDNEQQTPGVDSREIENANEEAQNLIDKGTEIDNISATPFINTQYIDIALSKVGELTRQIAALDGNKLQYYNMSDFDRSQMQSILSRNAGRPKEQWSELDRALFDDILFDIKDRSIFAIDGHQYNLTPELSAIYEELRNANFEWDANGQRQRLKGSAFKAIHPELADKYDYFMSSVLMTDGERQTQNWKYITDIFNDRAKRLSTTEEFSTFRKQITSAMGKVAQDSEQYRYYEQLLKDIDKRDKSKKGNKKDDPKQRAYELRKMQLEEERRTAELLQEERNRQRELEIAQMEDNSEKEIATIKFNAEKKRQALLKEAEREAQTLEKNAMQEWLKGGRNRKEYQYYEQFSEEQLAQMRADWLRQAKENISFNTQSGLITTNETKDLQEVYRSDVEAMRSYLKEYGTFQEKKLAIAEEYAERIRNAQNRGEELTLTAQRDAELRGLEAKTLTSQIDWYSVFDNVGIIMRGQLEPLYKQLQEYVKSEAFRKSGADNQQTVISAMENIRSQLGTNESWHDLSSALADYQAALEELRVATENDTVVTAEYNRLMANVETANRNVTQARNSGMSEEQMKPFMDALAAANLELENYSTTVAANNQAMQEAQNRVQSSGTMLSMSAKNVIKPVSQIYTFLNGAGLTQLAELWGAFDQLKGGIDGLKALKDAADASKELGEAAESASDAVAETAVQLPGFLGILQDKFPEVWNQITQATQNIGQEAAEGVTGVEKGMNEAGQVIAKVLPDELLEGLGKAGLIGQIIAAVLKILDILKDGVGTLISSILDSVFNAISGIIDNILSGEIFKQIGESLYKGILGIFKSIFTMGGLFDWWGNGDSDPHLEEDIERLTATNEALRKAVDNRADEMREAATAGMGAIYQQQKGDIEKAMKNTQEMMARSGDAYSNGFLGIGGHHSSNHKIDKGMNGNDWARISAIVGRTINSASGFWTLTSEQMAKVAQNAPDLYAKIKGLADDGYKDAAQFMDEYIEYYKELEELENAFRESLTDVSFDSVKDEFKSMLLDMESDSEDFANNFEKMMQQAVINSLMNSKYKEKLKQWYEDFANAMNDKDGLTATEQERLKRSWDNIVGDAVNDRNNLKKAMGWDGSSTQQSSSRTLEGMSQDTGNAIEGRLTALQIAVESIRANEGQHTLSLADMTDELLQIAMEYSRFNVHQDNIERQLAKIYIELQTISENTGAIVKPIQTMQADIAEIKKNTKNI